MVGMPGGPGVDGGNRVWDEAEAYIARPRLRARHNQIHLWGCERVKFQVNVAQGLWAQSAHVLKGPVDNLGDGMRR